MVKRNIQSLWWPAGAMLLCACTAVAPVEDSPTAGQQPGMQEQAGRETFSRNEVAQTEHQEVPPDPIAQARILADILYEARLAHEDDRLTRPVGNNAYEGYLAALRLDPDNPVARRGMEDILARYQALARSAEAAGQTGAAQDYRRQYERVAGFERDIMDSPGNWNDYVEKPAAPLSRARIIADTLYAAKAAYDDNRLSQPARDNAYDRYMTVLAMDPGNEVALSGITEIVERYIVLADAAREIGQLTTAENHLQNARRIEPEHPELRPALARLEQARTNQPEFFALDPLALDARGDEIQRRLVEIAHYVREHDKLFLIVARSDAEGRWIYQTMREGVEGYRLRGDIAVGDQPAIRISNPPS